MTRMFADTTAVNASTGAVMNYFWLTVHGMATSSETLIKLIMWTLSVVGWMLTIYSWEGFNWFFVQWVAVLQYV